MRTLLFLAALAFCSVTFLNVQSIQAQNPPANTTVTPTPQTTSAPQTNITVTQTPTATPTPPTNITVTSTPGTASTTTPPGATNTPANKNEPAIQYCCNCDGKLSIWEWLLTFAPLAIFLIIFTWMRRNLGNLKEFLVEKIPEEKKQTEKVEPAAYAAAATDATTKTTQTESTVIATPPSTSRLVVFMAGFTALIIAVCLVCFWVYVYLTECKELTFDNLYPLLGALLVGVVPYGVNRLSSFGK